MRNPSKFMRMQTMLSCRASQAQIGAARLEHLLEDKPGHQAFVAGQARIARIHHLQRFLEAPIHTRESAELCLSYTEPNH